MKHIEKKLITSKSNPRIKELVQLQKKSRLRKKEGVFLVEGLRMTLEAPPHRINKLYLTNDFYQAHQEAIEKLKRPYELVSGEVFSYLSATTSPQGILGVIKQQNYSLDDIIDQETPLLLVLEAIQDPGNLGTIFRTAEAAGVSGLIMDDQCVDIYNPKTVRSTMGTLYRMPFVIAENLLEVLTRIKEKDIFIYATHLDGKQAYYRENLKEKTAFLVGNEGNGLSELISAQADKWITIPMAGQAESLNVAMAAGIVLFEAKRQRDNPNLL